MLYNNFIELRRECSFLDRVLAKNDVNEKKKLRVSRSRKCFSRVSLVNSLRKIRYCTREAGEAHESGNKHVDFVVEFITVVLFVEKNILWADSILFLSTRRRWLRDIFSHAESIVLLHADEI